MIQIVINLLLRWNWFSRQLFFSNMLSDSSFFIEDSSSWNTRILILRVLKRAVMYFIFWYFILFLDIDPWLLYHDLCRQKIEWPVTVPLFLANSSLRLLVRIISRIRIEIEKEFSSFVSTSFRGTSLHVLNISLTVIFVKIVSSLFWSRSLIQGNHLFLNWGSCVFPFRRENLKKLFKFAGI